jgi:hypothetical protein
MKDFNRDQNNVKYPPPPPTGKISGFWGEIWKGGKAKKGKVKGKVKEMERDVEVLGCKMLAK